jgi:hypothetical protein
VILSIESGYLLITLQAIFKAANIHKFFELQVER